MNNSKQILVHNPLTGASVDVMPLFLFLNNSLLMDKSNGMENLIRFFTTNISDDVTDIQELKLSTVFLYEIKDLIDKTKSYKEV